MRRVHVAAFGAALALSGCGVGPGVEKDAPAELRVTRDFGRESISRTVVPRVREGQTVIRLLQSKHEVETKYGGGFVQSIDGLAGSARGPVRRDWFYFVNGLEAGQGGAERTLSPGDVVHWDHHRWDGAMRTPAIVGAWPEPFVHGSGGKALPTRLECADSADPACKEVERRLEKEGVVVSRAAPGTQSGEEVLRVIVGPWEDLRRGGGPPTLEQPPDESGVFARFSPDGSRLDLLDESGAPARRAPAGMGLLAAIAPEGKGVAWIVSGVDDTGVAAAAHALDARSLRDAFAVAVADGKVTTLPLAAPE